MGNIGREIDWKISSFKRLDNMVLYKILQLRMEVFVVEQTCYYQDLDDRDERAIHLMGWDRDQLVAYARIIPKGVSYSDATSIGRVITHTDFRRKGLGKALMDRSIQICNEKWPGEGIKISAQTYLRQFYENLGFEQCGKGYLEDGIPHIPMQRLPG